MSAAVLSACSKTTPEPTPTEQSSSSSSQSALVQPYNGPMLTGKHPVILQTSMGDIALELDADAAPMTVTNFIKLAEQGYYNGLTFHRVINDFMIQGGDPLGNGTGGESVFGPVFKDEINANSYGLDKKMLADAEDADQLPEEFKDKTFKEFYELQGYVYNDTLNSLPMSRGAVAMANRGHDTNGSQFFIIQKQGGTPWLEGRHTVFGTVKSGMEVIDAIAAVEKDGRDQPLTPVTYTVLVQGTPNVADTMPVDTASSADMMDDEMPVDDTVMEDLPNQ